MYFILKKRLFKLYFALFIVVLALILPHFIQSPDLKAYLLVFAWIIAGFRVFKKFFFNIKQKDFFDENSLMTFATLGAVFLGNYLEAVSVMVLYEIGELLQDEAVEKSNKSISEIINIRAKYANVERLGKIQKVNPEEVMIGETIIVRPGERIPLDGVVAAGQSSIDASPLTGESIPKDIKVSDYILSGCINISGIIKIQVEKPYSECAVNKLMQLVDYSRKKKSKTEKFMTKFAKIYTPIVFFSAVLLFFIPFIMNLITNIPLIGVINGFIKSINYTIPYLQKSLIFLVISCPCAFVISIPLTFYSGIGAASKSGILIKGGEYVETLSNANIIAFDKTGTLTKGNYKIKEIILAQGVTIEEFKQSVLRVENASNHPIAKIIRKEFAEDRNLQVINNCEVTEIPGKGLWLGSKNIEILVGNKELMNDYGIPIFDNKSEGTKIYAAKNKKYLGCIIIMDEIKNNAKSTVLKLKEMGIKSVMLTGDIKDNAKNTAKAAGIKEWYSGLLPEEKVKKIEEIIKTNKKRKKVLYAGDGINDAPVIMRADAGIAMGAIGSDSAIEAADVVITDDNLPKIVKAIKISRKTISIAKQNIYFALGTKILFLVLGTFGFMTMWAAIFADTGVTLIAILNSLKIMKIK